MKAFSAFVAILLSAFAFTSVARSAAASPPAASPEAFARQLVALVRVAPGDYRDRRGAVTYQDADVVLYKLTSPSSDIPATSALVRVPKNGQRPYVFCSFGTADAVTRAQTLFASLPAIFAGSEQYNGFTADAAFTPIDDGRRIILAYYRGITVAKLIVYAEHDKASLMIGFLESEDLNADLVKFAGGPAPVVEPKTWGSAWADALMALQHSANRNYDGIVGAPMKRADGAPYFAAPLLLGADQAAFYPYPSGTALSLIYKKTNRARSTVERDAHALYAQLLKSGRYQQGNSGEGYGFVLENDRKILSFWFTPEKNDPNALEVFVYQSPPMVDEARYAGKIPAELTDTSEPQIVEVRGKGSMVDSSFRANGIFKEGILISGYKTYRGYSDYHDGVWFSDDWIPSYGNYGVIFHPAYSRDVVYGYFRDAGDMTAFDPDTRYTGKNSELLPSSPGWLLTTFANHAKKSPEAKRADYDNSAVMRDGFPYQGGPPKPTADDLEIYAALDRLMLQGRNEFSGVSLGPRPAYAKTDESHDAPTILQADQHYIFAGARFAPSYVAGWSAENPKVEAAHRAVRAYMLNLAAHGEGKISTTGGALRFYTHGASIAVNGVRLDFTYNDAEHPDPLFSFNVGTHRDRIGPSTFYPAETVASGSRGAPTQNFPVHMHTCPTCGGRGRVLKTDRYGNSATDVCPTCNGQREVPE